MLMLTQLLKDRAKFKLRLLITKKGSSLSC